jgi:class 3 adenylate cyclase
MEAIGSQLVFEDGLTFSADPGESQTIKLDLKPGHYFFTNSDFSAGTVMVVEGDLQDSPQHVIITYDGQTLQPGSRHYNPGQFSIEVVNTSPERAEVSFARSKEFPWVSGAIVASNQNFRDLFSTELIKPNASFSIQNLVLLFTDIKGSTEMYERLGDARAYALVREHFDILFEKTKSHHGAVVKTIGDAVMASFLSPVDAITSAMEMHKAFHEFNARDIQRDDIIIKVGIHRGPSIVVTSNDKLDYFGRTVNMAARVQGLSGGNDIMVSQSFFEQTGVASAVEQHGWHITPLKATLKGISGLVDVLHLTLPEQ